MLKYFFYTSIRYLQSTRIFSFINIFGLAIGLATSILLFQYIFHEIGYDEFHQNYDNIYRSISRVETDDVNTVIAPTTISSVAPALISELPEVEYACRIINNGPEEVSYKRKKLAGKQCELFFSDADFFKIFSFKATKGNPYTALQQPNTVVVTERIANEVFGLKDPIGKLLEIGRKQFIIKAVLEDIPINSHMKFDVITSFLTIKNPQEYFNNQGVDFFTYFLVNKNSDIQNFKTNYTNLCNRLTFEKFSNSGVTVESYYQKLKNIHLHSDFFFDIGSHGNFSTIIIFLILAIVIIVIAAINFINLITATAENRGKEVSMKKIMGATRSDLIKQFLGEAVLLSLVSLLIAYFIVELSIKPFGNLVHRDLTIQYFIKFDFFVLTLLLSIVIGILSGLYPSIYMSGFNPLTTLRKLHKHGRRNKQIKIFLVIIQFTIAIFLITNIFILNRQIMFMKDRDPGFDINNVMVIKDPSVKLEWNYLSLKTKLLTYPNILSVTAATSYPGELRRVQNIYLDGKDPESGIIGNENRVQADYIETYQMRMKEGRSFTNDFGFDRYNFILNETAVKELGLIDPIGQQICCMNITGSIIGVVEDYHYHSLHDRIEPLILSNYNIDKTSIAIKIKDGNNIKTIKNIENVFYEFDRDFTFNYMFISNLYEQMYASEERNNILIAIATALSIFISVLGLFSLTSYTVIRRTKEIGLRKSLGASVSEIVFMLIKDISKWVILVNIIAWPLSYIYMKKWLSNFAYQVDVRPWMFIISGLITFVIAVSAVSYQSVKAARSKTIDALRYE